MARPTTTARRRVEPISESAPARPIVRTLRGGRTPVRVEFDVRTVYDFVISLSEEAGSTDDLLAEDRRWLAAARADLVAKTPDQRIGTELCVGVGALAVNRPDVRTAAEFIDAVAAVSPTKLARTVMAEGLQDPTLRPLIERALAGEEAVLEELSPKFAEYHEDGLIFVLRQPEAYREHVLTVLRIWLAHFSQVEDRVAAMIRRDADARAGDLATIEPIELIEKTTGGVRWLPEPGVRRVVLAPSYFARPYNYILMGDDWRFFGYPIADGALDAADPHAPPAAVIRLHRALGDETRLRILRLLVDRDWYLTEIAQHLELSKPTVKHHLAQLRSAGLVTATDEGQLIYYSLRRKRIEEAGPELLSFLDD